MIDTATIKIKAGNGGDGLVSFRREKFVERGGPWGGDGGNGGSVIFQADPHVNTLSLYRTNKRYFAQNGQPGMKNLKKGTTGDDLYIKVPVGTMIKDENNNVIKDLGNPNEELKLEQGGRGGLGNWHFKSSVNQAPRQFTEGVKTQVKMINMELKLIADGGIIGLPSSGKSTLINSLTRANAKTAAYHFTTLEPNLGVLNTSEFTNRSKEIILADIPGLIEGASEGKGLGHDFLRHVERTKFIIHLIDGEDIIHNGTKILIKNYQAIRSELAKWNEELTQKYEIVVVTKADLVEVRDNQAKITKIFEKEIGVTPLFISAVSRIGLSPLVEKIIDINVDAIKKDDEKAPPAPKMKVFTIENLPNRRIIFKAKTESKRTD